MIALSNSFQGSPGKIPFKCLSISCNDNKILSDSIFNFFLESFATIHIKRGKGTLSSFSSLTTCKIFPLFFVLITSGNINGLCFDLLSIEDTREVKSMSPSLDLWSSFRLTISLYAEVKFPHIYQN